MWYIYPWQNIPKVISTDVGSLGRFLDPVRVDSMGAVQLGELGDGVQRTGRGRAVDTRPRRLRGPVGLLRSA
jgi:hypothetical protein